MSADTGRIIDLIGAALILGIILRWGGDFSNVVTSIGNTSVNFYKAVSLQGISSPSERTAG